MTLAAPNPIEQQRTAAAEAMVRELLADRFAEVNPVLVRLMVGAAVDIAQAEEEIRKNGMVIRSGTRYWNNPATNTKEQAVQRLMRLYRQAMGKGEGSAVDDAMAALLRSANS